MSILLVGSNMITDICYKRFRTDPVSLTMGTFKSPRSDNPCRCFMQHWSTGLAIRNSTGLYLSCSLRRHCCCSGGIRCYSSAVHIAVLSPMTGRLAAVFLLAISTQEPTKSTKWMTATAIVRTAAIIAERS